MAVRSTVCMVVPALMFEAGRNGLLMLMRLHCIIWSLRVRTSQHFPSQFKRRKWLQVLRAELTRRGNIQYCLLRLAVFNIDKVGLRREPENLKAFWHFSVSYQSLLLLIRSDWACEEAFNRSICIASLSLINLRSLTGWYRPCHRIIVTVPAPAPVCLPAWSIFTTRKLHFPQGVQWRRPAMVCRKEINCNPDWLTETAWSSPL